MKYISITIIFLVLTFFGQPLFAQGEQKEVMQVVQQFFQAMEKNDSVAFRNVFLPDAYNYYVRKNQNSVSTGSRPALDFLSSIKIESSKNAFVTRLWKYR